MRYDCILDVKFYKDDFYFVTERGRVAKLQMNLPIFLNFERRDYKVALVISRDSRLPRDVYLTSYLVESTSGDLFFVKAYGVYPADREILKVNMVSGALTRVANLGVDCHFVVHNHAFAYDATQYEGVSSDKIYKAYEAWIHPDTIPTE